MILISYWSSNAIAAGQVIATGKAKSEIVAAAEQNDLLFPIEELEAIATSNYSKSYWKRDSRERDYSCHISRYVLSIN